MVLRNSFETWSLSKSGLFLRIGALLAAGFVGGATFAQTIPRTDFIAAGRAASANLMRQLLDTIAAKLEGLATGRIPIVGPARFFPLRIVSGAPAVAFQDTDPGHGSWKVWADGELHVGTWDYEVGSERAHLTITEAGQFGLGTNAPDSSLTVDGTAHVTGFLTVDRGFQLAGSPTGGAAILDLPRRAPDAARARTNGGILCIDDDGNLWVMNNVALPAGTANPCQL